MLLYSIRILSPEVSLWMYRLVFYFLLWDGHKVSFCCVAIYRRKQKHGDVDGGRETQDDDWTGELGCPVQCSDLSTENPAGHHTEADQERTRHARGTKGQKSESVHFPVTCNIHVVHVFASCFVSYKGNIDNWIRVSQPPQKSLLYSSPPNIMKDTPSAK